MLFRRSRKLKLGSIFDRPAKTAVVAAGNANKQVVSTGVNGLCGVSVRESAGAATAWRLRDGTTAAAPIVAAFGAAANNTGSPVLPPQGVAVSSGALFLENVSGSGEVTVWYG